MKTAHKIQSEALIASSPAPSRQVLYVGSNGEPVCQAMQGAYGKKMMDTSFKAYCWLQAKVNAIKKAEKQRKAAPELPSAIICELHLTDGNAFRLFTELNSFEALRNIPFIVLGKSFTEADKKRALKMGIDDFYPITASAKDIMSRIDFLNKYKQKLSDLKKEKVKEEKIQLPRYKRIFDLVVASSLLLVLSPFMLITAILVKLESRGPILYISKRAGIGYQIFDFYKFRSMRVGADSELSAFIHLNEYETPEGTSNESPSPFVKLKNDPRVTRLGKFLRMTSIDELPQLFNVIKGDMSIVGNRPLPLYEAQQLTTDQWSRRFLAPAGITGLWQVTRKGGEFQSVEERKNLDVAYVEQASLWMDLKIIIKTLPALYQQES